MTDLMTPDDVKKWGYHRVVPDDERTPEERLLHRFSRDYLTLWDELEHEREISDKAVKRVTQLEQEIGALMR